MKSRKLLSSFIKYCLDNPDQRFWQALRNWSGYNFIYGSNAEKNMAEVCSRNFLEDTFYKEGK